ncbi:MAG: hypothetical protein WC560_08800 [Syntrophales bacterium]
MRYTPGSRGSATILMILIASVIITVGIGFNWLVREHIKASDGLKTKAEAILKARSAYDTIIYLVLNGQLTRKEITVSGCENIADLKALPLNGEEVLLTDDIYVRLQDSNGMLSLASLNVTVMERLFRKIWGMDNVSGQIDSLRDWIDADDLSRINGAEAFYYRGEGLPYTPRNYPLQYMDELKFIKGFDTELYDKIQPYLTMLPNTGFNPNTASDEVLMAYLDINEESLKILKDYMLKKAIASNIELFALTGRRISSNEEGIYFYPSVFLDVTVSVGRPRSLYTIKAGLNTREKPYSPYGVVYWREE